MCRLAALELKKRGQSPHFLPGNAGSPVQHRANTKRKDKSKGKNDNSRGRNTRGEERCFDPGAVKRQKTHGTLDKEKKSGRGEDSLSETRCLAADNLATSHGMNHINNNASSSSGQDKEGVYEAYTDGVLDTLPWMEGDGRSLEDLVHDLLLTNPRYSNNVQSIVDKLKEKTILMDNPDRKKKSARRRNLKPAGVAAAGRKELQSLGALNVKNMGLKCVFASLYMLWYCKSRLHCVPYRFCLLAAKKKRDFLIIDTHRYDDLLPIHYIWREYKDTVLDGTRSFQEMQQLAQKMDLHGCYAIVSKAREARHVGLCGIVVADSSASYHILDKSDRCIALPKVSTEIEFELQAGQKMTLFSKG